MAATVDGGADAAGEVLVKFVTAVDALRVDEAPNAIPTNLNKKGLAQVIAHLLGREDEIPLEFYAAPQATADGTKAASTGRTLIRSTLAKYLASLGLSTESVLTLEYAPAAVPPKPAPPQPQDDWIGAVDATEGYVFAGLYDGSVRVFRASDVAGSGAAAAGAASSSAAATGSAAAVLSQPVAVGAVTSLQVVELERSTGSSSAGGPIARLATAGHDGVVRLWTAAETTAAPAAAAPAPKGKGVKAAAAAAAAAVPAGRTLSLALAAELVGCEGAVASARVDPSGCRFVAAGDARGAVHVWSAADAFGSDADHDGGDDEEGGGGYDAAAAKRSGKRARTTGSSDAGSSSSSSAASGPRKPVTLSPIASSTGIHSSAVTGVAWVSTSDSQLASASLDASLRLWDVEAAAAAASASSSAGGASSSSSSSAIGGGGASTLAPLAVFLAPKSAHCIAAAPLASVLATGHSDRCVRVWDTRSASKRGAVVTTISEAEGLRSTCAVPRYGTDGKAAAGGAAGASTAPAAASSAWVSDVAWSPTSAHHLAAACLDGTVTVWDVRAPKTPLFALHTPAAATGAAQQQMLSVGWTPSPLSVVFGGADKQLRCAVFAGGL